MKCFERIILTKLVHQTQQQRDPLQFAYKHSTGTNDAVITLSNHAYTHIEKAGSFVCILYPDFWSAFDTMHPYLLTTKMPKLGVNPILSFG